MQLNLRQTSDGKVLYDAWEVRTPVSPDETFKEAIKRVRNHAKELGIEVYFRHGKGQRLQTPRYHSWEVHDETSAMALYLAAGNFVAPKTFNKLDNI